jgi:hypothetical protein
MAEWIKMTDQEPLEGDILFHCYGNLTSERIGLAIPDSRVVLLKRTDISFSDIKYWIQIPDHPDEQ